MSRFIVTRTLPAMTAEELEGVGKKVVEVCDEMETVTWIRSHLTADGKHSFCEFEAPSPEAVREHASRAGLPVDDVIELGAEIGPSLFT